jgi:hypothetical protein
LNEKFGEITLPDLTYRNLYINIDVSQKGEILDPIGLQKFILLKIDIINSKEKKEASNPVIIPQNPKGEILIAKQECLITTLNNCHSNAILLFDIYNHGFAFPRWSVDFINKGFNILGDYKKYAEKTKVFYDNNDDINDVKKLVTEREPVNIAMSRFYDKQKMKETFGWEVGYYSKKQINIAIYCYTPILYKEKNTYMNVINVIAPALDSKTQPDYSIYIKDGSLITEKYLGAMEAVFIKIFKCAKTNNFNDILLSAFGQGNFAGAFSNETIPQYFNALENIYGLNEYKNINIHYFGFADGFYTKWKDFKTKNSLNTDDYIGGIQDLVFREDIPKDALFINAWDPWSLVGNGNEGDNSLDGYVGRISAAGILCWPLTNPYIQYIGV